ncbi:MAG: trypsin-like peptidase domain-containing protein [Acidobacteriota bacterium]
MVSISATRFSEGKRLPDQLFQDPVHWFFGTPDNRQPRPDRPRREESGGSGFLITPDGYILTNYHVIEKADVVGVRVTIHGKHQEFEDKVVGSDPPTDLALVKIDANDELTYLELGDSSSLRVGEWVMAIGNPFFYEDTVSVGVVSAKGRRLTGLSHDPSLDDYIQTDAAINPGNSGGPLINLHGQVVGINSAVSRIGQGIGFAIPIDMAKEILPQLRAEGKVQRGAIGVTVADISQLPAEQREYFNLKNVNGALVQDVVKGEPADEAGVKPGDAIIAVDGHELAGSSDLISRISRKKPGDTIELNILRDGRRLTRTVRLEDREALWFPASQSSGRQGSRRSNSFDRLGLKVGDLDDEARRAFKIENDVQGVVITDVWVRGVAYDKGLRPGMIILEVNRRKVRHADEYREAMEKLSDGDLVTFYIVEGDSRRFVTFRLKEKK